MFDSTWIDRATRRMASWLMLLLFLSLAPMGAVMAHKASDAYLALRQDGGQLLLRWDVALRDLDGAIALDSNNDGQLTWGEIKARQLEIEAYMLSRWQLTPIGDARETSNAQRQQAACLFKPERRPGAAHEQGAPMLEQRVDGVYYVLNLSAQCADAAGRYRLGYSLMQEIDPTHRGLLRLDGGSGGSATLLVLAPGQAAQLIELAPTLAKALYVPASVASAEARPISQVIAPQLARITPASTTPAPATTPASAWTMFQQGIHHILIGTDHILFLLCLLLPSVLRRGAAEDSSQSWTPVSTWREALAPVLMTITMFTLAHSITLALAALKLVSVSPRVIEPAIALTIAVAAIDNIKPLLRGRRYWFTFLFGLIHGFGFAGVLAELDLPVAGFVWALLQFNLGVEAGQLMVVLPALAVLWVLRPWPVYARWLMPAASALAVLVALGWFVERVFDLGFMPI